MTRLIALCLALLALPAAADVTVRLDFAYDHASSTPETRVQVTDLLQGQTLTSALTDGEPSHRLISFTLPETSFAGPYARLRLAVEGLHLPASDNKADQPIVFAFEMILRRSLISDEVTLNVPVASSSRKSAVKAAMEMPQIAEEVPSRFFLAHEWASL